MSYIYTTTQLNFNCYTNAIRIANLKLHAVPLAAAKGVSECVRSRLMHAYTYHIPYPHRDFPIVSVCTSVFMCIHVYSCVCLCLSSCGVVWCGISPNTLKFNGVVWCGASPTTHHRTSPTTPFSLQVNIFMVDLDVGFRQSPLLLVQDFMRDPSQDILVQVWC